MSDEQVTEAAVDQEEKILLHVGSGPKNPRKVPPAYKKVPWREVRFDIDPSVSPHIIGDIRHMEGVEAGFADALLSSHNLEHLFPHEVPLALAEFYRVLKLGGHAMISCPDLQAVAAFIAEGNLDDPIYSSPAGPVTPIDILYGFRPSLARGNHFMAHRTGFTAKSLGEALSKAGFGNVRVRRQGAPGFELYAQAVKGV